MSCYITYETIDGQTIAVHNYTGNVDVQMTSANNGGAGYVPPACSATSAHSSVANAAHPVPEPSTSALFALALVVGAVLRRTLSARRGRFPLTHGALSRAK